MGIISLSKPKKLGILGLNPRATAYFYSRIVSLTPARKEWDHIHTIIELNPKIPSRGRYFELGEENPAPHILQNIINLSSQGCNVVAVPCNTAHILFEQYSRNANIYTPHIVKITLNYILNRYCDISSISVLASQSSSKFNLFNLDNEQNVYINYENSLQNKISKAIEAIKQNNKVEQIFKQIKENMLTIKSQVIILACTELSLLYNNILEDPELTSKYIIVDSTECYAKHIVEIFSDN